MGKIKHKSELQLASSSALLLDCQTTGASPRTGDLLEIAWQVYGNEAAPVSHLVELPDEQLIPTRIEALTGITNEDMDLAVSPKHIAKELKRQSKENSLCVIHYARFETPFLLDLFHKHGNRKSLPFDIICTFEIAKRLYPNLPSRGIRAIGGFLGIELDDLKRARSHVSTTAAIWQHLLFKLEEKNISTLEQLGEFLASKPAKRTGKLEYPLEPSKRLSLPDQPGVYQMLNRHGKVLYVGKASSLKSRVNSHFRGRKAKTSKSFELLTQVIDLRVIETKSPLEAAIVETDLIKEYDPKYNTSLKSNNRSLWFYNKDFSECSNKQSKKFFKGPYSSSNIVDDVIELSVALAEDRNYQGNLYGIDDGEMILEGLELFIDRYFDDLNGDYSVSNLLLLGLRIYRWKRNLLRQLELEELDLEEDEAAIHSVHQLEEVLGLSLGQDEEELEKDLEEETEEEDEEIELTDEDVFARFESMLVTFARAHLRSKELTKMLNCQLHYPYRKKNCSTVICAGELASEITNVIKREWSVCPWKNFGLDTFDRLRVIQTEVGRMRTDGKSISLKPDIYFLSRWKML